MLPLLNGRNNSGVKSFENDGIPCFTNSCIRSCRKIRLIGTPRHRCPLQSAAVRTGGFSALRNGRNIVPGITAVPKTFPEELRNRFPGRMPSPTYPIARWEQAVFLSDKLAFVRQKRLLCEAGAAPESRPFRNPVKRKRHETEEEKLQVFVPPRRAAEHPL